MYGCQKKKPEKNVVHDFHVKTRARVYNRFLKYTAKHQIYTCKSRLFVHFFAIAATAWLRCEAAYNIMFYGGREHWATKKFSFSIWTWIYVVVYRNSTSGKFTNIWQSKWVGDKVGELLHDPYFITFGHVLLDKNLGLVDSIYQRFGNSRFWNLISLSRAKFKVGFQPK